MSAFLLSVHVLAAILTIGPVAIAASTFPRFARLALAAVILPKQTRVVRYLDVSEGDLRNSVPEKVARRLGMLTGVFNLIWAVVVVLMTYRPGSTTGVGL